MEAPTILVVEDDPGVRQGVVDALTYAGYRVLAEGDGGAGRETALRANYQLLLLDLVLPGCSGFDILKALKRERPGQSVIILSARGEEADRVQGLKMGADDYVVKPFSVREMLARVDAVLRRTTERPGVVDEYAVNGAEVDFSRREVRFEDGGRDGLSEREAELLRYLVAQAGRAVPREELLRQVWGIDPKNVETRTVDMHVAHIRKKLRCEKAVVTVRGKGYMIGR